MNLQRAASLTEGRSSQCYARRRVYKADSVSYIPQSSYNHQAQLTRRIPILDNGAIEIDDIIANDTMHHQQTTRAGTAKREITTAQWHSTVENKNKINPLRTTKRGKAAVQHTGTRHLLTENQSHRASHVHHVDKTARGNMAAAEYPEEIEAATRQLVAECDRVVTEMYNTPMAVVDVTVEADKLAWTLGCLTMLVGRGLYSIGKGL
jgi:hypothetical protein